MENYVTANPACPGCCITPRMAAGRHAPGPPHFKGDKQMQQAFAFHPPSTRRMRLLATAGAALALAACGGSDHFDFDRSSKDLAEQKVAARLADPRPTLKAALEKWLARTPIDGSTPAAADDVAQVDAFLARYLDCHARGSIGLACHWDTRFTKAVYARAGACSCGLGKVASCSAC